MCQTILWNYTLVDDVSHVNHLFPEDFAFLRGIGNLQVQDSAVMNFIQFPVYDKVGNLIVSKALGFRILAACIYLRFKFLEHLDSRLNVNHVELVRLSQRRSQIKINSFCYMMWYGFNGTLKSRK